MNHEANENNRTGLEIAVIGMAGRFPGARDIAEFWENLKQGVEAISFFSDPELEEAGVSAELTGKTNYIKARGYLEGSEYFDAAFFEYLPAEAEVMDPQMRLFHECVWTALEDAGYDPGTYPGFIGVYAGASAGLNWQALSILSGAGQKLDQFSIIQLRDKDFLATRLAYKLNLKGPSLTMTTACSTSLVAVNLACQGMLSGECDMALAGGVTMSIPQKSGYIYQEGMIGSLDGHCRVFDSRAKGTVFGSGVAVVVLKLLEQAIADRDHIYAVIKGSATNNDGRRKAGYSAPSIDGQAEVIKTALQLAEAAPESIGYVETHGTGTILGDPVEMAALKLAFAAEKKGYCAIGAVKSNIGHLDSAAGVTGLIKAVLVLHHKLIPPSLHFETPNPEIDFTHSPFYVNDRLSEWNSTGTRLRRAGVSSFGIGGTNAHVVLEEWPGEAPSSGGVGLPSTPQIILLSAKTKTALDKQKQNLADYFTKNPGIPIADVAYTLQVGRKAFKRRKMLCCSTPAEAATLLAQADPEQVKSFVVRRENRPVIFMFSGQGSQYVNMGRGLYESQPLFRQIMDECFEILKPVLDFDLKEIIYPHPLTRERNDINRTEITQPVIFIVEYALAKLLMSWGIEPKAMIGHSIGEYTAACLSGVFSLAETLKLVVNRGRLMQRLPDGAMLSVLVPEEEIIRLLEDKELSLAAVNSSKHCVVSGSHEAVDSFAGELEEKDYKTRRLHTSHAFHSQMMEPMLAEFEASVKEVKLNKPGIPYISNVTGNWIKAGEAVEPGYWARQIRRTVRFSDGLKELLKEPHALLVEVGPGKALCAFVRQHEDVKPGQNIINLVRHPKEEAADDYFLFNKLGQLWLYGAAIDWNAFYEHEQPGRISLPTYPFEKQRYWIEGDPFRLGLEMMAKTSSLRKKPDKADWFYIPSWERSRVEVSNIDPEDPSSPWLVFLDKAGIAIPLVETLKREQEDVILVRVGSAYKCIGSGEYILNPAIPGDYDTLFRELKNLNKLPGHIGHFWSVTGDNGIEPSLENIDKIQDTGLFSLLYIVQAIGRQEITHKIRIGVISDGLHEVTGAEVLNPGKATLLGAVKIIPLEYPNIECKSIDIPVAEDVNSPACSGTAAGLAGLLLRELRYDYSRKTVAVRGNYCWVPVMKSLRLGENGESVPRLKQRGVYLITGGMGGMGFTLADHLAHSMKARLIILGRSPFPPRQEWDSWLSTHGEEDGISIKIKKIRKWEEMGAEVKIFSADISNLEQVQEILTRAKQQFGTINGVLHTAGLADYEGVIQRRNREKTETIMAPKVKGTLVLDKVLKDLELDFLVLFSSIGNILYQVKFGQVGYNAANEFLDAYACYKTRKDKIFTTAVNWCDWLEVGMSAAVVKRRMSNGAQNLDVESLLYGAVTPGEGVEIFNRILASNLVRVSVSIQDLNVLLNQADSEKDEEPGSMGAPPEAAVSTSYQVQQRPEMSSEYAAPENEIEQTLAEIWQRFFSIDQVGIYDDFFELGGDSLQVVTVASHIHKAMNISIPIQVFFSRMTIKKLAEYIAGSSEKTVFTAIEPVEEKEYYSLSSAQKRIYILQQSGKDNTNYNQPMVRTLDMELDREKIGETFKKLIRRHESLRTSFELIKTEAVQKIHRAREVDISLEYRNAGKGRNHREIIRDFVRPFDLGKAPLYRALLIKVEDRIHVLMVDFHHIISDGTSNVLFVNEFIRLYNGEGLPLLRIQYKEFSEWQNNQVVSGEIKKQEAYWLQEFAGDIPVLNLPIDYARPDVQSFIGDKVLFEINREELEILRGLVKLTGSTMFIVIFTIFNIFLAKLTGQEDIVTGTITMGRRHSDLDNIIGMFVNTMALRNYPVGGKIFIEFLKEVRERTLNSFDNQDYQFEELVDKLQVTRDTRRNPIFDVLYTHRSEKIEPTPTDATKAAEVENPDVEFINYAYEETQSKFDLVLASIERLDRLIFLFVYRTELFKRETIERFIGYFKEILSTAANNKNIKLEDIKISHDLGELKSDVYQRTESDFAF